MAEIDSNTLIACSLRKLGCKLSRPPVCQVNRKLEQLRSFV